MALAAQVDVEKWLGRPLTASEAGRVESQLVRAEALVMGFLRCAEEPNPVPDAVQVTVAEIVGRSLAQSGAAGIADMGIDDGRVRFTADASSGGVWLSATDKLALRRYRCGGGLTSVQLVGDRYKITPEDA